MASHPDQHEPKDATPFHERRASPRGRRRIPLGRKADAWIDSTLYESRFALGEWWENTVVFFRRFRTKGAWRLFFETASEGFTLGVAGAVGLLLLALPVFDMTRGDDWRTQDEFSITFLDRFGEEIGQRGIIHRDSVPVEELPDHLVKAVLGTEDRRFYDHYGIDPLGILRALITNAKAGGVAQGGSTLTQQLAKNVFLSNERSLDRKIKEAYLALWLEANLTKNEILRLYLDRAFMGGGTHGVAAASEFYFGKSVKDVTLAEAAMLAGLFKAPSKYAPHVNLPAARARANEVLSNLVEADFMTEGQIALARRNPASVVDRETIDSPDYFLDHAFIEVRDFVRENDVPGRSFVVRTTFDRSLQATAEEAVAFHLRQFGEGFDVAQAAVVLLDVDGALRALVGGRDYGESQYNRATRALRQPGSAFKTFVYAAAMEAGWTPDSVISDQPITWNGWTPRNYGRNYRGRMSLTTALARSVNTIPVRLARDHLSTPVIADLAQRMGVESDVRTDKTMPLGTSEVTVMDMATAYTVLANGGYETDRHSFTQIIGHDGRVVFDRKRDAKPRRRVLQPLSAERMNFMLAQIPEWGTARRAQLTRTRAAGKTGTTQSYRDAWFVGFTGDYSMAVWFGNDDYSPTNELTGGRLPAMTWQRIMTAAHRSIESPRAIPGLPPFPIPPDADEVEDEDAPPVVAGPRGLSVQGSDALARTIEAFETARPIRREVPVAGADTRSASLDIDPDGEADPSEEAKVERPSLVADGLSAVADASERTNAEAR